MTRALLKSMFWCALLFLTGCQLVKKNNTPSSMAGGGGGGGNHLPLSCTLTANQVNPAVIDDLGTDLVPLILSANGPADSASMGILTFTRVNIDPNGPYLGTFDAIPDAAGNFMATVRRGNETANCSVKAKVTVKTGPVCRIAIDNGTLRVQLSSTVTEWVLNVGDGITFGPMEADSSQYDIDFSYDADSITIGGVTVGADTDNLVFDIGLNGNAAGNCEIPLQ